jgi:hypothetical protein
MSIRSACPFLLTAVAYSAGCAPQPPQLAPRPVPAAEITAPFDRVWGAVIDYFADNSVPIRTLEKASGLIATETMLVPTGRIDFADCGKDVLGEFIGPSHAAYNVRVTGDSAKSSVRVTAIFTNQHSPRYPQCVSRGNYERVLLNSIRYRMKSVPP